MIFNNHLKHLPFWPCAIPADMFGFLHPSVNVCPLFPQDHADSAELRRPAAFKPPD